MKATLQTIKFQGTLAHHLCLLSKASDPATRKAIRAEIARIKAARPKGVPA